MSEASPALATPPRPARPLAVLKLTKVALSNTLAACDEELFDSLFVERPFLWKRLFLISDPDGVRRVMHDHMANYQRLGLIRRRFEFHSATGLLTSEGETWRHHRRVLNPILDQRTALADVPVIGEVSEELARILCELPRDQELNTRELFGHLISATTGRLFAPDSDEIRPALAQLWKYSGPYRPIDFIRLPDWLRRIDNSHAARTREIAAGLVPLVDRLIADRRREDYDGAKDLVWRVVHATDPQTGAGLDRDALRDEVLTLGAAAETTVSAFPWLWYLLAMHPAAEQRVHRELDEVLGGRAPTAADMPRLAYLRRVVDETLRLYPPVPMMLRVAIDDDVVCGHRVPRKSIIAIMPWIIHRHRLLWSDPERFDPDRFTPEQNRTRSRYAYLPFSAGARFCIGASLAIMELVVSTAVLAQRLRFRLVPGQQIEPTAWINLHPRRAIGMTVEPR